MALVTATSLGFAISPGAALGRTVNRQSSKSPANLLRFQRASAAVSDKPSTTSSSTTTTAPQVQPRVVSPPTPAVAPNPAAAPALIARVSEPAATNPPVRTPVAVVTTCADALSYLASHAAPGFVASCSDGNSLGRYGFTCWNVAPHCGDGGRVIHIACPALFVYQNEAHNSWALIGERAGIDPFGQGNPAERAFCDNFR